jgi:3-oxoacyl-[acyl-carrier-protein] synthase II
VLIRDAEARRRGAKIYAEVVDTVHGRCVSHHRSVAGEGAARCMRQARRTQVCCCLTSTTSTLTAPDAGQRRHRDASDQGCWRARWAAMTSPTKSQTGHLLGGAGGGSRLYRTGTPGTASHRNHELRSARSKCDLDYVPNRPRGAARCSVHSLASVAPTPAFCFAAGMRAE